mmetsp:Transcript_2195/g.5843  ORF Transcript_2195/g.5843 Transcript_2195/m.5843 type:complete len:276 (+) Transcript_2195:457-1284(+)
MYCVYRVARYGHLRSRFPVDFIFPEKRCLGILVWMSRSASPIFAILFIRHCALSAILIALLRMPASRRPDSRPVALGARTLAERPRDIVRDLLLCTRFFSSPPSPAGASSAARDALRSRLRPRLWLRTRSTALLVSMPIAPRLSFMRRVVSVPSSCARFGSTAWLFAVVFLRRCSLTMERLRVRMAARSAACSSVRSSSMSPIEPAAMAAACACSSSASSRSSSASRASMSSSTKSNTLWPSNTSGTTSYFHASSARLYRLRRSALYTPAPPFSS